MSSNPDDPETLNGFAEFQERYGDRKARETYRRAAAAWKKAGKTTDAAGADRRAVLLDLVAGDRASAESDLAAYRALGGSDLSLPESAAESPNAQSVTIPGPLRSFARMAALAPDVAPEDLMPALARNVVLNGYQTAHGVEELAQTEYLRLIFRYLSQAKELDALAGPDKVIRVPACDSTQTNDLLRVLGFRMRGGCGSELVLETVNAPRAFVTTDSGFPIAELEEALRTDKTFTYDYHSSSAPVLYGPDYWLNAKEKSQGGSFIETFISDPGLCRFYLGISKLDPATAEALRKSTTSVRLRAYANVLDFFGGNFEIRDGKAVVPGGAKSAPAWADLAGASPDKGPEFLQRLMAKDDGWLASLYDALARIHGPVQDYLAEPARLKRFYNAVRGRITSPGPARPVFRSNADMMLLTTRLQIDADWRPHVPGGLEVWKAHFQKNPRGRYDVRLSRSAPGWKEPDDVIEALFAMCRKPVDNDALSMFMTFTDMDRSRSRPLASATVARLMQDYPVYGAQYAIFNDVPSLSDKTMIAWLDQAQAIDRTRDESLRLDEIGVLQGITGLWEIFARQGSIPADRADGALAGLIESFSGVRSERDLFDAGRKGLNALIRAAGAGSGSPQQTMLALLAGGPHMDGSDARGEVVRQEQQIFEAQKLLPADLLFQIADDLEGVSKGGKLNSQLASKMSGAVADIQLPRSAMTTAEKNSVAFGYYVDKHVEDERKVNLRALIDRAAKDPEKVKDIRGQLAPSLRDTIVGYSYVHYAPPGAQILMTNPLFVRGHDFLGMRGFNRSWRTTEMYGSGWPSNAGGRLMGSLTGLPYALAQAEQNFLIPEQTQALIWGDLVPELMLGARTPRFWTVTPVQEHWVGIHMRYAEALAAEAALNPAKRAEVEKSLNRITSPYREALIMRGIASGEAQHAISMMTPSEMYLLAETAADPSPEFSEIQHLRSSAADQVGQAAISRAWGSPKPTLASSYRSELLNLRTFPTLMGYSSRIMAESWESNLLYWADVADQKGISPAELNVLVPEWTQKVVERIFASHLEDWPALLRSLRSVGDEVRARDSQEIQTAEKTAF